MRRPKRVPFHARRGTAGIIAAVFLFAMLFTVGSSYFLLVNTANQLYVKSLNTRSSLNMAPMQESLAIAPLLASGNLAFTITNVGGANTNITGVYVLDSLNNILKCDGRGLPSTLCSNSTPALPIAVNVGGTSVAVNTGYAYSTGTDTIKVVTADGGVFSTTYPQPNTNVALSALTAGAFGDLYLNFSTYRYYSITTCGINQCLTPVGNAFSIPHAATGTSIAFGIRISNLNKNGKTITLDPYSLLQQLLPPSPGQGGGTARGYSWYIISNSSTGVINPTYSPIPLPYNAPTTLIFASSVPGSFSGYAPSIGSNTVVLVSILTNGCEGVSPPLCTTATYNYGQNIPYVSTYYS